METSARGLRVTKVTFAAMLATAFAQMLLVLVTDSAALLADTIHNFLHATSSIPLWFALAIGRRPPTRRYTFGYRRAEDLAGLVVVAMIAVSAIVVAYESLDRLFHPRTIDNLPVLLLAGLGGFIANELVAIYRVRVGREIHSEALVADGQHARADGLTSLGVVVGAVGVALGWPAADPIVGLVITGTIVVVLVQSARQVIGRLMDAVDPDLTDQIERISLSTPGVQRVEAIHVRWIGHRLSISLHVTVDCSLSVYQGHEIAEAVRHELLRHVPGLDSVLIHIDPCAHEGNDPHGRVADPLPGDDRWPSVRPEGSAP
jgi:cation diffusion facilitator family transporter